MSGFAVDSGLEQMFESRLDRNKTTIFCLDGVNFSSFVKSAGCTKPFDANFTAWMLQTFETMMSMYRFHAGFTGSDEMSFVWFAASDRHRRAAKTEEETEAKSEAPKCGDFELPYSGRLQKLCSVLASKASAAFLLAATTPTLGSKVLDLMPAFDCRVWQVDTADQALTALHLRQVYTLKNSRMMFAQHYLGHKRLLGVSSSEAVRAVQAETGVKFEDVADEGVRIGTYAVWVPSTFINPDGIAFTRNRLQRLSHFGCLKAV